MNPVMRRGLLALAVSASTGLFASDAAYAKKRPKAKDDKAFLARLEALKKEKGRLVIVKMAITEDPTVLPATTDPMQAGMQNGTVLVASNRQGIYTPDTLNSDDIRTVIDKNIVDVRKCYKKQLQADPEWSDALILDLAIKKTGRVSEVSIEPKRVRTDVIGTCLMSAVPKWKFPQFTGESDEGVVQEVVNASFPFELSQK
jgi:hypothetical protein